jgi:hypothetical protein
MPILEENTAFAYKTLCKHTGIIIPKNKHAKSVITKRKFSHYSSSKQQIGIKKDSLYWWDTYFEEVSHAIRHYASPNEGWNRESPVAYHIVSEFFGGLGRVLGRAFTTNTPGKTKWRPLYCYDKTFDVLESPKAWVKQSRQKIKEEQNNKKIGDFFACNQSHPLIAYNTIGHQLGYLLAENYFLPNHPKTTFKSLYSMKTDDIANFIFPAIINKSRQIKEVWDALTGLPVSR